MREDRLWVCDVHGKRFCQSCIQEQLREATADKEWSEGWKAGWNAAHGRNPMRTTHEAVNRKWEVGASVMAQMRRLLKSI